MTQADAVRSSTEVPEKARRRRFTAEYKQRILREADACTKPGELGALLRREGLYSSNLTVWRAAVREGGQKRLEPQKRGPQARPATRKDRIRIEQLERENRRLKARAERAEALVVGHHKLTLLGHQELTHPSGCAAVLATRN
jgi:transposase-like protein